MQKRKGTTRCLFIRQTTTIINFEIDLDKISLFFSLKDAGPENPMGFDPSNMDVDQIKEMLKGLNVDFEKENLNIDVS